MFICKAVSLHSIIGDSCNICFLILLIIWNEFCRPFDESFIGLISFFRVFQTINHKFLYACKKPCTIIANVSSGMSPSRRNFEIAESCGLTELDNVSSLTKSWNKTTNCIASMTLHGLVGEFRPIIFFLNKFYTFLFQITFMKSTNNPSICRSLT